MAEATVKGRVVGLEDGRIWLPAPDVFSEPWDSREACLGSQLHRRSFPVDTGVPRHSIHSFTRLGGWKTHHKPRYLGNRWASTMGGPGMQAVFLETGRRSCGTGFFLPRRAGTEDLQPSKRPGCSSVLLPNKVVQALNLNVHQLGSCLSPQRKMVSDAGSRKVDIVCYPKGGVNQGDEGTATEKLDTCSMSPELLLPKEWTY